MIVGAGVNVNEDELVAVPPAVVTPTGPVVAPAGTCAVTSKSESTEKTAAVPLNVTRLAPVKPVPVMDTLVPTVPLVGVNELIVGGEVTVNEDELAAVPPGVVTLIGPVVAPVGTCVVISVDELTA